MDVGVSIQASARSGGPRFWSASMGAAAEGDATMNGVSRLLLDTT